MSAIDRLPTVDATRRIARPVPKGRTALVSRAVTQRTANQRAAAFRAAVWARDEGRCRYCRRKVVHTLALVPERGEVHHWRGRRVAPEDKYNTAAASLLCATCHQRAQRHEITRKDLPACR